MSFIVGQNQNVSLFFYRVVIEIKLQIINNQWK